MISVNKKIALLCMLGSFSWLNQAQTISIPHDTIQDDVSLFILAEDFYGNNKIGIFDFDTTEQVKTITNDDLQDVYDATLNLEGEEVAIFDSNEVSELTGNILYFEIAEDVLVVKALIISNSLLNETFIQIVDVPVEMDEFDDFDFADDIFGEDLEAQQECINNNHSDSSSGFSPAQLYALVKIGILLQIDNAKRAYSSVTDKMKRAVRWSFGYDNE